MPDAARAVSGIPRTDPGGRVTLRFWHRLNRFRHFCGGSLALASLDRACRNLVPAFPQRSPPRLLTAAACGGLRSAPDCRTRRALLHLSYSCASPVLMTVLVTHDPQRSAVLEFGDAGVPGPARRTTAQRLDGQDDLVAGLKRSTRPPIPGHQAWRAAFQIPDGRAAVRPLDRQQKIGVQTGVLELLHGAF